MLLEEARAHIGRFVRYNGHGYHEIGVITSVNATYIFVRYEGADPFSNGAATYPQDLALVEVVPTNLGESTL